MDRLTQLRGEAGGSRESTLEISSPPSEAYITANESSSSKFFSLSEDDSTFDLSPLKDVSLASAVEPDKSITESDDLIANLSPISKKSDLLDSYKIGKQIEAANILSGGVNIFDDNENSYDGDELVIDDNAIVLDDKGNPELKVSESELPFQKADDLSEGTLVENEAIASKDTEVVLQIDGKNVNAIDIGNGLYLYRKEGEEELAAVQIVDDDQQQPSFKFLKVRENAEGNLEVYEEIEIEVPKEVPTKEGKTAEKNTSHVPLKDINKVISDKNCSKIVERKNVSPFVEPSPVFSGAVDTVYEISKVSESETKLDGIKNSKMMKCNETKKSPFIHSTPNKEGIPLTKVMVNQQLHPNRHSDNVKTIEVHTDSIKQKGDGKNIKIKELADMADVLNEETENVSGNENFEVTKNKQDTSDIVESKTDPNSASKQISSIVEPLTQKDGETNEKKDLNNTDTNDNSEIKTNTETKKMQSSLDSKDNFGKYIKPDNKPEVAKDKIVPVENDYRANDKEDKNKDILESRTLDSIYTSIKEDNKTDKTPITVYKECEHGLLKKEPAVAKSESLVTNPESKINIISERETKNNVEHFEKKEPETAKKVECKDLTLQVMAPTLHSQKAETVNLDVNIADKHLKVSSMSFEESNDGTATELNKDTKSTGNKDFNVLDCEKEMDKLAKNLKREKEEEHRHKVVIVDQPDQSKIGEDVNAKPLTMKQFSQESTPSSINKDKLQNKIHCHNISADVNESHKQKETDLALTEHEKIKAPIIQASTNTSNIDLNKQKLELISTNDNQSKEISNHKLLNNSSLALVSPPVKQKEPEKTEILMVESTPKSPIKFNTPYHSESNEISIKTDETIKKQHIPIKLMVDKTVKAKNAVIQEKTETDNLPKKCTTKVENVASNLVPSSKYMPETKKNIITEKAFDKKPINSNISSAVPFGQWTEANRQEFLNKIKESKVPSTSANTNQIKQPNDLNRRDVLQKIDSQRQINSAAGKIDLAAANKLTVKNETKKFTVKPMGKPETKIPVKNEALIVKRMVDNEKQPKQESPPKHFNMPNTTFSVSTSPKMEGTIKRTGIYNQDLIDRTIEDIINRAIPGSLQDDKKSNMTKEIKQNSKPKDLSYPRSYLSKEPQPNSSPLDVIEMKMNELHGIPFVERPPHELPKVYNKDIKTYAKQEKPKCPAKNIDKIPNLVPLTSEVSEEKVIEVDSEEEVIEHEPITGDIGLKKVNHKPKPVVKALKTHSSPVNTDNSKKETIITEKDFDKFARRNSITYENCLTVNFEDREKPNVVHTVKEKDSVTKPFQTEQNLNNTKHKMLSQQIILHQNKHSDKIQLTSKLTAGHEDMHNKNYPSKLQMAYQSALTAKRHTESPITIIEDRPVKVVYMDVQSSFSSNQINVQGKDLSPNKKQIVEADITTAASWDSVDSDMLETINDAKFKDKCKIKHQRKQVLTPVDISELELIEPSDLGVEHSPKKKRKIDDKSDKSSKSIVPKKSYLLGRTTADDRASFQHVAKSPSKEPFDRNDAVLTHNATASAIDNLVKAAELLETQSENLNSSSISVGSDSQKSTPAKRGRGRPRKYPLPEGLQDNNKTLTPQKKPRLIDARKPIVNAESDEDDSSDEGIVQENWTMGKINENIVCPICNKLFRSENVVFKHVKHCTGPSPNRSDSDKRSLRTMSGHSQESDSKSSQDSKSDDIDYEPVKTSVKKETPKKRNSREISESNADTQKVIVIEDSPALEKSEPGELNQHRSRKRTTKCERSHKITNLACETCGKTFRQLSYLINHKLQHEKDEPKKTDTIQTIEKTVFTCEICKKEFRKLHHMVQHRLIHNPSSIPSRNFRKSSSEQNVTKDQKALKQADDQSAAFRCEPCDKSFRKLHHLVEHRETHDGINKQKGSSNASIVIEKSPPPPPECEICKKRFRKLHHLIEHKEQHQETSSEKSDDRSIKSALSTKDIIHECSLCYMVFPNEHSLNKHSIICQRKKRQLAAKQNKVVEKLVEDDTLKLKVNDTPEEIEVDSNQKTDEELPDSKTEKVSAKSKETERPEKVEEIEKFAKTSNENKIEDKIVCKENDLKVIESKVLSIKRDSVKSNESNLKAMDVKDTPKKRKIEDENIKDEVIVIEDTPKKKTPNKDKVALTKRKKTTNLPVSIIEKEVPITTSSDDEEVRYMFNPNFKIDNTAEGKMFMKVRSKKRNSLQLERPNSKKVIRRTSLQQPPKILRQKPKLVESRVPSTANIEPSSKNAKPLKLESIPSTDSDDSDVKYSFPETAVDVVKSRETVYIPETPKIKRKSLALKQKKIESSSTRKSVGKQILSTSTRKLLGKQILPKLKAQAKLTPDDPKVKKGDPKIRKRQEVDYRCDCGQLFHSAALLSRHTTLAHTPPRIRRRRSPLPEQTTKSLKPAPRKSASTDKPIISADSRKSSIRSDTSANTKPKRSVELKIEAKTPERKRTATVNVKKSTATKPRRTAAHRGVPVPDKMKKLVEKLRK